MYLSKYLRSACVVLSLPRLARGLLARQNSGSALLPGDLCYITGHRSTLMNNRLYFTGGDYTFEAGDTSSLEQQLYWLDMNASFVVDSIIPHNLLHSVQAQGSQWQNAGAFFTDTNLTTMYSFGGFQEDEASKAIKLNSVEAFNTTTETWTNASVSGGAYNSLGRNLASAANTATSGLGLSFITGGGDLGGPPAGMIRFDASDPAALKWTNETQGVPQMIGSTMQYARFGNKGVLVAFGGYSDLVNAKLYDMSQIMVYDVDSKIWSTVVADGDVPDSRSEFCSVITSPSDDTSSQITIYGGWNIHRSRAYEEVYALTLPSFKWINITQAGNKEIDSLPQGAGRYQHTCELQGERQMVVLGGSIRLQGESFVQNDKSCNNTYPSIRALDVSTFKWQSRLSATNDPYLVPDQVWSAIGGGPSGSATATSPFGGFQNTALAQVFKKTVPRYQSSLQSTTSSTPQPLAGPGRPTTSPSHTVPIAAAVGGTIGGMAVLVILLSLLYFIVVKRRRRKQQGGGLEKPGLSTSPSFGQRNEPGLYEMNGHDRPREIDGAERVEAPSGMPRGAKEPIELGS